MVEKEEKGCRGYSESGLHANVVDLIAAQTLPEKIDWHLNILLVALWKALKPVPSSLRIPDILPAPEAISGIQFYLV